MIRDWEVGVLDHAIMLARLLKFCLPGEIAFLRSSRVRTALRRPLAERPPARTLRNR